MTPPRHALVCHAITKRYGKRRALDGFSLSVAAGSILGIVGSNGAGKTTLLSIVAGITRATSGTVDVGGGGAFDPARHAGQLALMPQDAQPTLHTPVGDLLTFYARLQGMNVTMARNEVSRVLDWVHLSDRRDATLRTLSHGMRRRFVIAQAFLGTPALVLMDEPLSGLDPREVANMRNLLIRQRGRQTILISSHNLHEIERICDQVVFIEQGRSVRQDAMSQITGQTTTLSYLVGTRDPPLAALETAAPEVQIRVEINAAAANQVWIRCTYAPMQIDTARLNRRILPCLLENDIPLMEVRRGSELEAVYLGTQ